MSRPARLHKGAFAALGTLKLKELFLTCHAILPSILFGPQLFCDHPILADQLPSSVVWVWELIRRDGTSHPCGSVPVICRLGAGADPQGWDGQRQKLRPKEGKEFELTGNALQVKGALADKAPLTWNALP